MQLVFFRGRGGDIWSPPELKEPLKKWVMYSPRNRTKAFDGVLTTRVAMIEAGTLFLERFIEDGGGGVLICCLP